MTPHCKAEVCACLDTANAGSMMIVGWLGSGRHAGVRPAASCAATCATEHPAATPLSPVPPGSRPGLALSNQYDFTHALGLCTECNILAPSHPLKQLHLESAPAANLTAVHRSQQAQQVVLWLA
jgi:hypothetical protein